MPDGFHDVPAGRIAVVVTHLEMRARAPARPVAGDVPGSMAPRRVENPEPAWYRDLFLRVGGLDWLWSSRLEMDDEALLSKVAGSDVELWVVDREGQSEGMAELDFRQDGQCVLAFFGVSAGLVGTGVGRLLMNLAIERAWKRPIEVFRLHTCNLDSPKALPFYIRSGFVPVRRQVEIAPDPRLRGTLPREAGRDVPIIDPE